MDGGDNITSLAEVILLVFAASLSVLDTTLNICISYHMGDKEATSGAASSISRLTFVLSATSASLIRTQRILDAALCSAGSRQLLLTISSSSSRTADFNSGSVSKSYMNRYDRCHHHSEMSYSHSVP